MYPLLICPSRRESVSALATTSPLACAPILGASLVENWLEHVAVQGARRVRILASDQPAAVKSIVGTGERWGLSAEVIAVGEEPATAVAVARFEGSPVIRLSRLPGLPHLPLFESYASWFGAIAAWIPLARTPLRVGIHEIRPGIWCGLHSHVSRDADLKPPCWIGAHARVGAGAVIGPHAVIEDRAWVDAGATVVRSFVGPDTFVGAACELDGSIALGGTLINWCDGTSVDVTDPILLGDMRPATIPAPAAPARQPVQRTGAPGRVLNPLPTT